MSRIVGLGLTLIKNNDLDNESLNKGFIIQDYSFKDEVKDENEKENKANIGNKTITNLMDSLNELNKDCYRKHYK